MANFTQHKVGTFCQSELCSQGWRGAKTFYTQLFSWDYDGQPIGDDLFYTMLKHNGQDIAAMYQIEA